jgi:hypothetical protein
MRSAVSIRSLLVTLAIVALYLVVVTRGAVLHRIGAGL